MRVRCVCVPPHQSAELTLAEFDLSNSRSLATYHPKEKPFCLHSDVVGANSVVSAPRGCECGVFVGGRRNASPTGYGGNPVVRVTIFVKRSPRGNTHDYRTYPVGTGVLDCPKNNPICTHTPVVRAPLITKRATKGGSSVECEGEGLIVLLHCLFADQEEKYR